ncbi:2OG-Fe(II) oxygenase family protein, partial [Vibrio parahaemolyticus]|uniref:2OG-Fe(II) oxygenase family protein n=1 Tax=Vibrio parahaemolyticus TaxID=670 RepID=UPI0023B115C2
ITCNIGDMLMRWSDDELKSTLHRVRMPTAEENQGSRYSMAFFCQANRDQVIQGPKQTYPPITAQDYLKMRLNANFAYSASPNQGTTGLCYGERTAKKSHANAWLLLL